MSRSIEISDGTYKVIEQLTAASGITPTAWVEAEARRSSAAVAEPQLQDDLRNMAEVLAEHLGSVASGGLDAIAARPGDPFSDYLIEKKRSGRL